MYAEWIFYDTCRSFNSWGNLYVAQVL